jgi:transposase
MLGQEEFMDVLAMRRQGLSIKEIAEQVGYHPATVSKWIKAGGPPARRRVGDDSRVLNARWRARLDELLEANPRLLSTSLFDFIAAEGYGGSYPTVVRYVRGVRGPRFRAAGTVSVPIETAPGEEAQVDWSEVSDWASRWGWDTPLWSLGAILCWSRWRRWWFAPCTDRQHTFEGLVGFFEAAGGLPGVVRIDRMGALGRSQGRRFTLHPPTREFARHHGIAITACQAGDAKRKGKVERPFRQLKQAFLEELEIAGPPADVDELNRRAAVWLDRRVHAVAHRVTQVAPAERLVVERRLLRPLPRRRFDTAYVAARRVHQALPLIAWDDVRYSVPIACLGQAVEVRREVGSDQLVIRWAGIAVASHTIRPAGHADVWDPQHRRQAEHAALTAATGRHLHAVPAPAEAADASNHPAAASTARLALDGDYDVATPDLNRYGCGCFGSGPR